jgi:hypothetical protein
LLGATGREYYRVLTMAELPHTGDPQEVAPDGDHSLLMILGAFDPLIKPHHMASHESALIGYNQAGCFYESPLQVSVHISQDLAYRVWPPLECTRGTRPA